jgi:hypothetical protein
VTQPLPFRKKTVIERADVTAEQLGLQLWCEDEGGPYQSLPQPGPSWQPEGQPARRPHEYVRGETAKLLTLLRPVTGELRAQAVEQSTNAVLHPWRKQRTPSHAQAVSPRSRRGPSRATLAGLGDLSGRRATGPFFPPVRMLLILDTLAGQKSYSLLQ